MPAMHIVASEPPAIITSASPYSMKRAASPTQCAEVVQADTIDTFGPLNPYKMEIMPATILTIEPGTKNGEILRGPLVIISRMLSSIIGRPPIPEPTLTPMRSAFSSVTTKPASSIAILVAAMPKWMNVSIRRTSLADIQSAALNPFTSPAIRVGSGVASNRVIGPIPPRPLMRLSQAAGIELPTGETMPSPVMTTRLLLMADREIEESEGAARCSSGGPIEANYFLFALM